MTAKDSFMLLWQQRYYACVGSVAPEERSEQLQLLSCSCSHSARCCSRSLANAADAPFAASHLCQVAPAPAAARTPARGSAPTPAELLHCVCSQAAALRVDCSSDTGEEGDGEWGWSTGGNFMTTRPQCVNYTNGSRQTWANCHRADEVLHPNTDVTCLNVCKASLFFTAVPDSVLVVASVCQPSRQWPNTDHLLLKLNNKGWFSNTQMKDTICKKKNFKTIKLMWLAFCLLWSAWFVGQGVCRHTTLKVITMNNNDVTHFYCKEKKH